MNMKPNSYKNIMSLFCRLDESYKTMLNESQESKSISQAKRLVMQRLNYSEKDADEFVKINIRNDLPVLRTPNGGKFILGVTRMYIDGEIADASTILALNNTIKLVSSDAHINEYDRNLNGMSCQDIIKRFSGAIKQMGDEDRNKLGSMYFEQNNNYNIVRIDSFKQAKTYGKYTSWCVTNHKSMFNSYTSDGIGQFYFCLRNGFKNEKKIVGNDAPLDNYGLSMIAVCVDENGNLNTCTCRWNHDNGGNDSIMNTEEISRLIGRNFYEVFKPNNKWNELLEQVKIKLANNVPLDEIFDDYDEGFDEDFASVKLNKKYNFINKNGKFLSNQWFDWYSNFIEGFACVELNKKYNFINKNGKLLSNQWFDWCNDFYNGFALVKLNGILYKINTNGEKIKFGDNDNFFF